MATEGATGKAAARPAAGERGSAGGASDVSAFSTDRMSRLFSRRSAGRWRSLLELVGRIDEFEEWSDGSTDDDAFRYHLSYITAHA